MAYFGFKNVFKKTLKSSTIKDSFKLTGMYPVSLENSLSQCPVQCSHQVDILIKNNFNLLVQTFETNGQLTAADLESAGIATAMPSKTSKDKLTISHQRATLINHEKSIKRLKDHKDMKEKENLNKEARRQGRVAKRKVSKVITSSTMSVSVEAHNIDRPRRKRQMTSKMMNYISQNKDDNDDDNGNDDDEEDDLIL